jgi:carboxymethylenebutenolidase
MSGQEVTFDVNGQPAKGYLATSSQLNAPGVIVLHAWWGLNPFFQSLCDRLAAEGFVAFAPDLNEGRIAKTIDEAKEIMASLDGERKHAVATASLEFLRSRPEVKKEGFSLIGPSMGAAWALELASEHSEDMRKVVLLYGVNSVDFSKIKAEIIGHFSDVDEWEPLDGIRGMEEEMRAAGLNPTFYIYPNKSHWFFESDRPQYDPEAAELAWRRTLEFLHKE